MDVATAFWHLANVVVVPLLAGVLAATATWLVWRRRHGLRWRPLAAWASGAACAASLAGFAVTGHDGRIATYAAIVVALALVLWWKSLPS